MNNILNKIIEEKKNFLPHLKKKYSNYFLLEKIKKNKNNLDFIKKIKINNDSNKLSVIAEMKKASPSAGIIVKDYNPSAIAKNYLVNGATCLSILTEEKFFMGNLQHMEDVKKEFKIPILCKDFFIDTYQVSLAKSFGADAILIILACTDHSLAKDLYQAANDLNMTTIIEVHSNSEAENALDYNKAIIGINNRDLKTLKIDIKKTLELYKIIFSHKNPIVSESGYKSENEVKTIFNETGIMNFLIGESLLRNIHGSSLLKKITQIS